MKILFVTNVSGPDYMSDMVFHGGKSLFGKDFIETKRMWYMYDDVPNKENLYGKGFTMYGRINSASFEHIHDINYHIITHYFDKIIYGSIQRCNDYFDIVKDHYSKNDVIFIDGEDDTSILHQYTNHGKYYKRELNDNVQGVFPISFGIPKNLIVSELSEKEKEFAHIIPNKLETYIYDNEHDYYSDYKKSWLGITTKKGGWDCLRHYEILMNGCIPYFENLSNCPKNTLHNFPKDIVNEITKHKNYSIDKIIELLDYTKNNLTTEKIIEHILN